VPVHDLRRSADVVEVDARLRVEVEAQLVRDVGLVVEVRPELRLPALGEEDLAGLVTATSRPAISRRCSSVTSRSRGSRVRDKLGDRGREGLPALLPGVEHVASAEVAHGHAIGDGRVEAHQVP
jgi:hypothetical protein